MKPDLILPWQRELWSTVSQARAQDRLAQALLLAGPAGVGKRRFAQALAGALLCEQIGDDGFACGRCRGCLQFAAGTHPNLFTLRPLVDDKTDKLKRDISVEQLRDLGEHLGLSAHYGGAKVVLFDPADALNVNGVNALLKTIEEPLPRTYLLLISERPQALAATLRSRCQRLRFSPPGEVQSRAWLREQEPSLDADLALSRTQGAPLRALDAQRSGLLDQQNQWRRDWLDVAAQKRTPMTAAQAVGKERDQVAAWLAAFIVFGNELLRAKLLAPTAAAAPAELSTIAARMNTAGLMSLLDEAVESARRITASAAPQLLVESLMIAWWKWSMARGATSR